MAGVGLTDAARALRDRFGARLEAGEAEGRRLMCEALTDELGLEGREAQNLVDALVKAHSVRYVETGGSSAHAVPHATTPFAEAIGVQAPSGPQLPADIPTESSYWQL